MSNPRIVRYSRRLKRISLQRYLVSKMVYEPGRMKIPSDVFALYDNQVWLERKSSQDEDFRRKFGKNLELLSKFLKEANLSKGLSSNALTKMSNKFQIQLKGFYLPVRNYSDYKKRFSGSFSIVTLQDPEIANRKLPPKRILGVGYRDKGTARNPAKDGSPSWQEVASRGGQMALAINKIKEAKNEGELVKWFKVAFPEEFAD